MPDSGSPLNLTDQAPAPVIDYSRLNRKITNRLGKMLFSRDSADDQSKHTKLALTLFYTCNLNPLNEIHKSSGIIQFTVLAQGFLLVCEHKDNSVTLIEFFVHEEIDPTPPDSNPGNAAHSPSLLNNKKRRINTNYSDCYFVKRIAASNSIHIVINYIISKFNRAIMFKNLKIVEYINLLSIIYLYYYKLIFARFTRIRNRSIVSLGVFESCISAIDVAAATALASWDLRTTSGHGSTLEPANC